MPYSVNNTDSSLNFTVQDGVIDSSTLSVSLIGTNATNYADEIAKNDVQLLENFASASAPTAGTVLTGQLWYDKTDNVLRVYKGRDANDWVNLEPLVVATAPTRLTPRIGERYFDTSNNKFYIYDGAGWKPTGYAGEETSAFSSDNLVSNPTKFGAKVRAIFLKDTSGKVHPCMALVHVNNSTTNELYGGSTNGETLMAVFNHTETFTADNVLSTSEGEQYNYYAELNATGGIGVTINKGMNLRKDYIAEAVSLATEAITAQKANALFDGTNVINTSQFYRDDIDVIPSANITYTIGGTPSGAASPIYFDTGFFQRIQFAGDQAEITLTTDNSLNIGSPTLRANTIYTYDVVATDDITIGDDLSVAGNSNLTGNVDVTNNLQVNQNIRSNATVFGATLTDNTLEINSGSISQAVNGTFSGTVQFGFLSDGTIVIDSFVDEDNMASNSATKVPTQQSTKAYVDTEIATLKSYVETQDKAQDLDFGGDSGTGAVIIGNATVDSASMTFTGGDGITTSASGTTLTTDVDNTVVRTSGAQSIAGVKTFTSNTNFSQDVEISGNLNVTGTQTTVNTATLSVADNIVTLNSDVTGTPSQNAGIEVERGSSTNVQLRWNESTDKWQFSNDGSTYSDITTFTNFSVTTNSASGNGALSYNNSNGQFTFTPADTSLSTKDTGDLAEGSRLYYTDARVLTKIQATTLTNLNDVNYSSPNNGQALIYNGSNSRWEASTLPSGVTELVNLTDVVGGVSANTGQVLQKLANGNFGFGSVSTTNNFANSLAFNTSTGILTVGRSGLSDLTANLDGRYGTSTFSGSYNDLTNVPTLDNYSSWSFDTSSNGTDETVTSGDVVRFSAGTGMTVNHSGDTITFTNSSPDQTVSLTGSGATTVTGTYPNFTIDSTDNNDNTVYTAGAGLTKNTAGSAAGEFSHADTSSVTNLTPTARTYVKELTFDTYGHVTGYDVGTETVTNSDTNYYVSGASFDGSGTLSLTRSGLSNLTAAMASGDITGALGYTPGTGNGTSNFSGSYNDLTNKPTIPSAVTNNNQLTNGAGYITGYSETDTLGTVTGRGASTGTAISITNSTASTSKTTGALKVTGGIGVQGAGYFGDDLVAFASSDERLKDNIKPIENALNKLQKIRGVEFDWNDKQDLYTGHDTGVIAQEVKEVLPEVVTERENGYLAVKYEKMIGLLVESIKDLKAELDELKQQLNK